MTDLLTDDEVAALSVTAGEAWPGALPTIPNRSRSALTAAVNRGLRSLAVRGLSASGAQAPDGVGAAVAAMTHATRRVAVAVVPAARPDLTAGGGVLAAVELGSLQWTIDTFTVNGVHSLSVGDAAAVLDKAMAMAEAAFTRGVLDASGTDRLAVGISMAERPGLHLVIQPGVVSTVQVAQPGERDSEVEVITSDSELNREAVARALGMSA